MITSQTEILLKDNSDLLKGRVINKSHYVKTSGLGNLVNLAITKVRTKAQRSKKQVSFKNLKNKLNYACIIQTKKSFTRLDGSSLRFHVNCGVAVSLNKVGKLSPAFKRINTCVPLELKLQKASVQGGFIKCANHLV